jgi:hypothetical protein
MRITFVHIQDQAHYDPTTASLAGVFKERAWMDWHVFTDFSTTKDGFVGAVRANEPLAVAFRVTKPTREIVRFLAGVVAEQPEQIPVIFYGPLCQTHPEEVASLAEPAVVLTGEGEVGLENLLKVWRPGEPISTPPPPGCWFCAQGQVLRGADGGPADLGAIPKPDLVVFGGDRIFRRGVGASLFGELKVLPFLTGHGTPAGMPANATLHNFSYATTYAPRVLDLEAIIFRLRALGPRVDHIELWDRELGWDGRLAKKLLPVLHTRQRKKTYSMRVLAQSFDPALLDLTDATHSLRLVTELDSATAAHHAKVPGMQDPDKVAAVVDAARSRGLHPALLVSVGLPFETRADIEKKIDFIRKNGVRRVRFAAFEPAYGHPVYDLCEREGMLKGRGEEWNREVFRPLTQESLPAEDWHVAWQKCLDLQAELQMKYPSRFEPAAAAVAS